MSEEQPKYCALCGAPVVWCACTTDDMEMKVLALQLHNASLLQRIIRLEAERIPDDVLDMLINAICSVPWWNKGAMKKVLDWLQARKEERK